MNMLLNRSAVPDGGALANVYTRTGRLLRVPLRRPAGARGPGCVPHPEQQFMRWFNRQVAANSGFPSRVRSILLVSHRPCASCQQALVRFLSRFSLGHRLRLLAADGAPGCRCGQCQGAAASAADGETDYELAAPATRRLNRPVGALRALQSRPPRVRTLVRPVPGGAGGAQAARASQVLAAPLPPTCATPAGPRPTLRFGARGEWARYLQCRLNFHRVGLSQPLAEDGVWGAKTQAAVRSFQQGKGLAADAVVGPLTWGQLDAGIPAPPSPTPQPQPPSPTTDVALVRFRNAADIDAFFRARTGQGFVDWFNGRVGGRGAWVNRNGHAVTMPATDAVRQRFAQFWDGIPLVFNSPDINFAQFAALQSVIVNETGGRMEPLAERVGTAGHPGIAYAFDRIPNLKVSYNQGQNKTALELFNTPEYVQAHGRKALADRLARTTDRRWAGDAYPAADFPTSTDPAVAGFVHEADFYKFRGRGFIQITWRPAYQWLIPGVQNYTGADPIIQRYRVQWQGLGLDSVATRSSNADWDALFLQSREFALNALKVFFGRKTDSINRVEVGNWPSVRGVARDVMGTQSYMDLFERRVRQIFDTLGAAPAPAGPPPGGGAGPASPPGGSVPPPAPATAGTETALRNAIIDNALRMMAPPTIEAKARDENGLRKGWPKLKAVFELAAPAFMGPGWEEHSLKRSTSVGQVGIPHWCGIFALWATKAAGLRAGTWRIGSGISGVAGFRQIRPEQVKKGDIGYINQPFQHHFLVREVHPDGTIDTIDGNSGLTSTISTKSRVSMRSISLFFTAF